MRARDITPDDDDGVACIIRRVMTELGASGQGFAIHDAEVDAMWAAYQGPRARYLVVESDDGRVLGGGGYGPLAGGDDETCELRKMYFLPEARGLGMGRALLERLLSSARAAGFRTMYLETLTSMAAARKLYEATGFRPLCAPMGKTGHFGCNSWFARSLDDDER